MNNVVQFSGGDGLLDPRVRASVALSSARILIADDADANVLLLQRILGRAGYTDLRSASDGQTALELAQEINPDLILLDLQMPRLSGVEVLERLRGILPEGAYLPVLVLTADPNSERKREALALGAMDFLVKPFDATEVLLRVRNLLHTRSLHMQLEARVEERTQSLRNAQLEILERLARAGEFRDDETGLHAQRVGDMAARIARGLGLPENIVGLINRAAPLHDVGKIGATDTILLKAGPLTEEEWLVMKRHTVLGAVILANGRADLVRMAETIALCHHERWDGTGYPRQLKGEEIPLVARIVAVADVFDALSHNRVYRPAWPMDRVIGEISKQSGSQFDPDVVAAFLRVVSNGGQPASGEGRAPATPEGEGGGVIASAG